MGQLRVLEGYPALCRVDGGWVAHTLHCTQQLQSAPLELPTLEPKDLIFTDLGVHDIPISSMSCSKTF